LALNEEYIYIRDDKVNNPGSPDYRMQACSARHCEERSDEAIQTSSFRDGALDPSIRIENFAYPYGLGSVSRKRQLGEAFRSSRGILPGINSGIVDLQFLRANPLIEPHMDPDGIDRAFDQATARNGWLIFYSHDVATTPSPYGCSPSLLRHALKAASRRKIPILSIAEALRRAGG
jgi:hypothetical protein